MVAMTMTMVDMETIAQKQATTVRREREENHLKYISSLG